MPSWKGQTRGGLLGYRIFVFILKNLGIRAAYFVLRFVVLYFIFFAPKATISLFQYFRRAQKFSVLKSAFAVVKNFFLLGQTIIDKVVLSAGIKNNIGYTFTGEEFLMDLKHKNQGALLISAHVGSWDIAGFLLKRLETKVNIVMYEAEHEKIKTYLSEVMGQESWKVIPIKNDLSHIFLINAALAAKEIVCIHGDRFVDEAKVMAHDFYGKKAYFPAGPFMMATKLSVPYSFVYCVKSASNHYDLFATPIAMAQQSAGEVLTDYVERLQHMLARYPYQWFNYYDFWEDKVSTPVLK
ncbi:MAG: lipid A biosynthesis acyltransferase [Cyclobacteriaceae bacterium]|nr:lipid A biosynthesis acyltransferase [Cyclobacteriaceae bacterium]